MADRDGLGPGSIPIVNLILNFQGAVPSPLKKSSSSSSSRPREPGGFRSESFSQYGGPDARHRDCQAPGPNQTSLRISN